MKGGNSARAHKTIKRFYSSYCIGDDLLLCSFFFHVFFLQRSPPQGDLAKCYMDLSLFSVCTTRVKSDESAIKQLSAASSARLRSSFVPHRILLTWKKRTLRWAERGLKVRTGTLCRGKRAAIYQGGIRNQTLTLVTDLVANPL